MLYDSFDPGFLTRSDATNSQAVGIWGALKGSILTMFVTLILAFPIGEGGAPPAMSMGWYAGIIELVAGALLVLGLFTRPAAFIASGTMAVAYWYAHAPQNFFPVNNGGDAAILYCFVFLYLVFAGPGPWSLDAMRDRRTAV